MEAHGADPLIGRRLGEFRLVDVVGSGAYGVVYRAEQPLLQREAAVKVQMSDDPQVIAAFLKEARLASGLDHPYAAHIYGFGVEPDHVMWCAMELVRGTTLERWVEERGPMACERFLPLFERICEVVQTAHDKGIVHRDLKPANVMVLSRAGRLLPKLLDFGIARGGARPELTEGTPEPFAELGGLQVTQRGLVGSPAYMAPEQWLDASEADASTDQYALAALCFQVLTGKLPFATGTLLQIAERHAKQPVPPLGDRAPAALHQVIARAMAKDRSGRFENLMRFAAAFREALDLPPEAEALPQLDEALRDALALTAPQPVAESITALETARDHAKTEKLAGALLEVTAQYVGLVALSGLVHVPAARRPKGERMARRLAELVAGRLDANGWLDLACEIAIGLRDAPGLFPTPELVTTLGDPSFTRPGDRADLRRFLADLGGLLGKLAWISDYPIAAVHKRALESWTGPRRTVREIGLAPQGTADGSVVLLDRDGAPVLTLSPLVQVARPSPGMPEEMFWFDGADKRGARLRAHPVGFDRRDPDLAKWLNDNGLEVGQLGAGEVAQEQAPYRGLATFQANDAGWFFGREREVEAFVNRMRVAALLAVVGPSGAGKSSFVQAGVLPSLPEGTTSLTVRPGANPVAELATRVARAGVAVDRDQILAAPRALAEALQARAGNGMFVLIVDQLEELFTLGASPEERRAFSEAIVEVGSAERASLRVILTLRDDFLVRAEQLPALRQRLAQGLELLTTPAPEDLERILVEPARRVGYHFEEEALVAEMVHAVAEQPGALPLLSFTASRLWELRDVRYHTLTRRSYQALGGVGGALAKHADETLAKLPADHQPLVREIFRHLVTSEGTRAVLSRDEAMQLLGGGARAESVLEQLVGSRLVVASEGEAGHERIEVAHEALINAWPRLVRWRQEDAEIVRVRDQLRATARQWAERGKPQGLLWRDEPLAEYRLWRTRYTGALTELEDEFGSESVALANRAVRRRRIVLASAFAVLAAGAITMTLLGFKATRESDKNKRMLVDSYFEQARTAVLDGRQADALDYIHRLNEAGMDTPSLRLMAAYARPSVGSELARLDGHGGKVLEILFSPDGKRLYSAHEDGGIRVWDVAEHRLLATWKEHTASVRKVVMSPDGRLLASASDDGTARVWDTSTGRVISRHPGQAGTAYCIRLDAERGFVLTAGPSIIRTTELATGRTLHEDHFDGLAFECALDPQARWAVVADRTNGTAWIWDPIRGERLRDLPHRGPVVDVELAPDGNTLATASYDGNVRLWSLPEGTLLHEMAGHGDQVDRAEFSPDGKRVVSIGRDLAVRVWDAATGSAVFGLRGHRSLIYRARFDSRGERLVTSSQDGTARLWDLQTGRLISIVVGSDAALYRPRFSPDGSLFAAASWDGTIALWSTRDPFDVETSIGDTHECQGDVPPAGLILMANCGNFTRVYDLRAHRAVDLPGSNAGAVTADGVHVATAKDGAVATWDLAARKIRQQVKLPSPASVLAWSPSGDSLVIGTTQGLVLLWEPERGGQPTVVDQLSSKVTYVVWGPAGPIVVGGDHGELHVMWPSDRHRDRSDSVGAHVEFIKFSPDGSRFAVAAGSLIQLRASSTGEVITRLPHEGPVVDFNFDETGGRLISGARDSVGRVWRVSNGELLSKLPGAPAWVVSPHLLGTSLAVATGGDGALQFWDVDRGQRILSIPGGHTFGNFILQPEPDAVSLNLTDGALLTWHLHAAL
jgi:WD40 repeat protein